MVHSKLFLSPEQQLVSCYALSWLSQITTCHPSLQLPQAPSKAQTSISEYRHCWQDPEWKLQKGVMNVVTFIQVAHNRFCQHPLNEPKVGISLLQLGPWQCPPYLEDEMLKHNRSIPASNIYLDFCHFFYSFFIPPKTTDDYRLFLLSSQAFH